MAKDLDSVYGLCQVFARVSGTACDLHVESLVCGSLGDDNPGLESVIEDDAVRDMLDVKRDYLMVY